MPHLRTAHRPLIGFIAFVLLVLMSGLGLFGTAASASGPSVTVSCSQTGTGVACTGNAQLAPGTTATGFLWNYGDGTTSTLQNPPPHTYAKPGTYTITFTVTDSSGQQGSASTSINFTGPSQPPGLANPTPSPTPVPTQPPTSGPLPLSIVGMTCNPNPAQVNQPVSCGATVNHSGSTTIVSTTWNMGDGTVFSSASIPAHPYTACGSFLVTLTAADSSGSSAQQSVSVNVIGCQSASSNPPSGGSSSTAPSSVICNGVLIQASQCPTDTGASPPATATCPDGSHVALGSACPQPCTPAFIPAAVMASGSDASGSRAVWAGTAHAELALASNTVHFAAGWNIVAAPSGSLLAGATSPYFAFGPGSTAYQPIAPGDVVGGRGVWAYFPGPADVPLGATAATFASVLAPPSQWVMIGNPSSTAALPLHGADAALAYTPGQGYVSTDVLQPGQGAWVLSFQGGAVSVGTAGSAASEIGRLQAAITADPTDRSIFNRIASTTSELLQARLYSQVQTATDDLWSAAADGLVERGAGNLPALSNAQRDAASAVREALAQAAAAQQAGDLAGADRAVEKAKAAAQASTDDGLAIAHGQGSSMVFAAATAGPMAMSAAANNLASFGALLHAAIFSITLGQAPSDDLWSVATALINGSPVPQAAGGNRTTCAH